MDEITYPETPELDKLQKVKDKSQAIGEFFDWLKEEKGIFLAIDNGKIMGLTGLKKRYIIPYYGNFSSLLSEFFEIDERKIEEERREVLEFARRLQTNKKGEK